MAEDVIEGKKIFFSKKNTTTHKLLNQCCFSFVDLSLSVNHLYISVRVTIVSFILGENESVYGSVRFFGKGP